MPHDSLPFDPAGPSHGVVQGVAAFGQAVQHLLARAAEVGAELTLIDADFARWPLSQPAMLQAWHDWALTHRAARGRLLAQDWSVVARQQGAWVRWQAPWSHRLQALQLAPEDATQWPGTLMVARGVGGLKVQGGGLDQPLVKAVWHTEAAECRSWLVTVDVILQRSTTIVPHSTFGL